MLKNFRLIATVLVFASSGFGALAQNDETNNYKDVLLDGKPAKLNLVTGEIIFTNGEIAKSRTAKKIKDSVLDTRTEIKTNLLKDVLVSSEASENKVITDTTSTVIDKIDDAPIIAKNAIEENDNKVAKEVLTNDSLIYEQSVNNLEDITKSNPYDFHMVKTGETLYKLSKRYDASLGQLKMANDLETTLIKAGQTLRVRNFESSQAISETVWVVSKGDTLYNIAKRNNTSVDDLKELNELSGNLIKIGQKLQVNQNSTLSKK
ncbi:LysM peptidoglycan-binding domain-containing protein [Psychroserpens sp.]